MTAALVFANDRLDGVAIDGVVDRCAQSLRQAGVCEGDAIAIMLRNEPRFLIALRAARLLGAYAVPINWHFQTLEVGHILRDSGARLLFIHDDLLSCVAAAVPPAVRVVALRAPSADRDDHPVASAPIVEAEFDDVVSWDDWLGLNGLTSPGGQPRSSMSYTSGTTGQPKGVRRDAMTALQVARVAEVNAATFGLRRGARVLVTTPLYHSAPNVYALTALMTCELLIIEPRFDAERTLRLIEEHAVTHMYLVPTLMHRLLRLQPELRVKYDLSSLSFVLHGAAPCPQEVKRSLIEWWGPVVNEFYGGGEAGPVAAIGADDWLRKPGSVGRLVPYARVLIADEAGAELPAGTTGTIYVEQQAYPPFTYHGRPDLRAACAHPIDRALFTLGDVGHLDADGFLFLSDRKTDMVISGGVNVYPAEIESVLIAMPGVRDCAVFGIPDVEFGERLMAVVEVEPTMGADAAAVQAWLRQRLAGYKVPGRIEFAASLPREESGKIFKRKLRDPYWVGTGRSI